MTKSIGVGVIGMGWMGTAHSRAYRQVPQRFSDAGVMPRLVICADEIQSRAENEGMKLGFERVTTDWREVIQSPDVQIVNIAAPNHQHLEIVRAATAAGKHVFCEKPVGRSPEETAEIEQLARKAGVKSFVGFNYRWAPLVQFTRQLISDGRLGTITHYRGRFFSMYGSNPHSVLSWRFQKEAAGLGTLGDLMSHAADMAHFLVGPMKRVVANQKTLITQRPIAIPGEGTHFSTRMDGELGAVTNEDYVGALVEFEDGVIGSLEACRAIYGPKCEMAFEINGTKGAVSWNFERMNELQVYLPTGDSVHEGYVRIFSGPEHPFHVNFNPAPGSGLGYDDLKVIEAYQFLKSVSTGVTGAPSFRDALHVAEFQAAVLQSWNSGGWADIHALLDT